jgi:peptide/nickel transport system substrate-binding protein
MSDLSRRFFLGGSAFVTAAMAAPRLNLPFLFSSAYAETASKPMMFLGAEALTGNWDPTTHTNLGQLIFESFVFGYLTRCPMKPSNPEELVFELATAINPIDKYTLEFKLATASNSTTASRSAPRT